MGKTLTEKVLGRKAGKDVQAGEVVVVSPDYVLSHDNSAAIIKEFQKLGVKKVKAPEKIVIVLDHIVPAADEKYAQNHKSIREFVAAQGIPNFFDINAGICHQVLPEQGFALPGKVIVGSDSHTPSYGALGAFATGIGRTETACTWATDEIWLRVPETMRIDLSGRMRPGVFAKDLSLKLIGDHGAEMANYKAVEFAGPAASDFSVGARLTLANMSAEMGAKNGYFAPDDKALKWLEGRAREPFVAVSSDPDARYESVLAYDLDGLEPQIACPHTVDNVKTGRCRRRQARQPGPHRHLHQRPPRGPRGRRGDLQRPQGPPVGARARHPGLVGGLPGGAQVGRPGRPRRRRLRHPQFGLRAMPRRPRGPPGRRRGLPEHLEPQLPAAAWATAIPRSTWPPRPRPPPPP